MRPGIPAQPIIIDGIRYPSLSAATQAHNISRKRLTALAKKHRHVLTSDQLTSKITPKPVRQCDSPPAKPEPTSTSPLSWEFVYRRISSSPKNRRVDSSPAAYQSA